MILTVDGKWKTIQCQWLAYPKYKFLGSIGSVYTHDVITTDSFITNLIILNEQVD
jgi:hypothetical protein